jgi:hypothetical protein
MLDECRTHHVDCRNVEDRRLPSKLLSIIDDRVLLVDSTQVLGDKQYVALSYCWGGEQEQKTTTSNVEERESTGIEINTIPKTFKDAAIVTRQLGLSYLLIDSLCMCRMMRVTEAKKLLVSRTSTAEHP